MGSETTYEIYGIGAALVDIEAEISLQFLEINKIKKSVMTLVTHSEQNKLLYSLNASDIKLKKASGGSVCNSVVASSQFGSRTFFSGCVASDSDGKVFLEDLKKSGVTFPNIVTDKGYTGRCLVMVTDDADRTMYTSLGCSNDLSDKHIDKEALKKSKWLFIEGYQVTDYDRFEMLKNVINFAKRNDVKIALSLSDPGIVMTFKNRIMQWMSNGVDLIFCNKMEAEVFSKKHSVDECMNQLSIYSSCVAITDGENGSFVFDGQSKIHSRGVQTKAIDTNGAGDMFSGAFLSAISKGWDLNNASEFANYCASKIVSRFGPRLTRSEVLEIKTRFGI